MRTPAEIKSEQIVFRTWPALRRVLEAEATRKEKSVGSVINSALRARFAKKLRALERASNPTGPEAA